MKIVSKFPFSLQCDKYILVLAFSFALMALFIQEGFSYYVSVQIVALFFLAGVLLHTGVSVRFTPMVLAVYILFSVLLLGTATVMPDTISQNSPNIMVTSIGVLGYVALILAMINLRPVRSDWLLLFYRHSAAAIVTLVVTLVFITDLGLIPGMTREFFILQNVNLITNYTTMDVLERDLMAREAMGVQPDIDLLYGEQSFLSLVLFVSLVSHVISSRALEHLRGTDTRASAGQFIWCGISTPLWFSGMACMIYIQSFSSLFYATILFGFILSNALRGERKIRLTLARSVPLLLFLLAMSWVAIETSPYYWHRLTTFSDSLSAQQRFGIIFNFLPQDFLLGLHERNRMPPFGFHNGLIYIVMMTGIGGVCLIAYLMHRVALLAHPSGLAVLSILVVLAIFSQSGAILSPNKLVILSFVLLPLISRERENMLPYLQRVNAARVTNPILT